MFIPGIRKSLRVLIPGSKRSDFPSEPIAAAVPIAKDHGYFNVVLEHVFEFGDGAVEGVAGADLGA